MKKFLKSLKTPAYSNWLMLSPDDEEMCRCGQTRVEWYLKKGLADIISNDPPIIKLKFIPNGHGNKDDAFSLSKKKNICVVCGVELDLTKHHIVPSMYRKHLPIKIKSRSDHDVVVICVKCHESYETVAMSLKQEIHIEYTGSKIPIFKRDNHSRDIDRAKGFIEILSIDSKIPEHRKLEMKNFIKSLFGYYPTYDQLLMIKSSLKTETINDSNKNYGKIIVDKMSYDDIQLFVERWRAHFLYVMKPKFMPDFWDVHRKI